MHILAEQWATDGCCILPYISLKQDLHVQCTVSDIQKTILASHTVRSKDTKHVRIGIISRNLTR